MYSVASADITTGILLPPVSQVWQDLKVAFGRDDALLVTAGFIFVAALLLKKMPSERGRIKAATLLFGFSLLLILASGLFTSAGLLTGASALRWAAMLIGGIAVVNLICIAVFDVALGAANLRAPRILQDLIAALGYVGVGLALLKMGGVGLSDIITTSAVVTAIIAFSLQDTLGNIMGGLALQMEKSIQVGDWIRVDQSVGRVKEIRWRHTAIETRNWDTIIIPNTMLMKGEVTVLGRRAGQPVLHRQWVYFNVDFRVPPTEVIAVVNEALQTEPVERVAGEPKPHCILYDFKESYCHYAVRYWLTDLAVDDPTDSVVRTRVFFALKRAGIPLSLPAQSVFVTEESEARKSFKQGQEIERRLKTLAGVELFHSLNDEELRVLAERLQRAPFAQGEAIIKQGAEAHRLYIITRGSAEVHIAGEDGLRKTIATLQAGDFFGEMSLMTGEKRAASVLALEDMECYRLDREAFHDILLARPEIAEHISRVLARRRTEYEAARDGLDAEARSHKMHHAQRDIFARISAFFGLGSEVKG